MCHSLKNSGVPARTFSRSDCFDDKFLFRIPPILVWKSGTADVMPFRWHTDSRTYGFGFMSLPRELFVELFSGKAFRETAPAFYFTGAPPSSLFRYYE